MKAAIQGCLFGVVLLLTCSQAMNAQIHVLSVRPELTAANIRSVHGDHLAYLNTKVLSRHRLVVSIPGTTASAKSLMQFDTIAANIGYHVISLDYDNNVVTTTCSTSNDSSCFDRFREEIVFGTPVSPIVQVDSANSIVNRLQQLLHYLVKTYPKQGWQEYIGAEGIQWDKIVVAGHSQGSGHAAFLAKKFKVARVLVFAGPQDYLVNFHAAASWERTPGKTDPSRYFAFLHTEDPYDFRKQLYNCRKLMEMKGFDTLYVRPDSSLTTDKHIFITNVKTGNPHESMIQPEFSHVWEYMLEAPLNN
ncbi:MAG: hypothetical protein P4L51_13195 [Puia sp.]|nr:hypothetical protein [Puia sp.]